jgi:flagellar basal-body rod modification protein FlgD
MSSVSANYSMPTILNNLTPNANSGLAKTASAKANTASTSSTSSSDSSSSTGIGSTFLSLLAQELQNQDPTAPVDATAMVGQMISLNQLQQLISINQTISGSSTASGTTTDAAKVAATTATNAALTSASDASSTLSPSTSGAVVNQLPFDPNTMMPLGFGNTSTTISSPYSSINAAPIGFSGSANKTSGGK